MKEAMRRSGMSPPNDEFRTPPEAVDPLLKYLYREGESYKSFFEAPGTWTSRPQVIWEPCCMAGGFSGIADAFEAKGFEVIRTGVDYEAGFDFLLDKPNFYFDYIITNPPYSLKTEFIKRCYSIGYPWAMLMPITALEGIERGEMYRKRWLELLVLDKRIQFQKGKKGCWFNTSWFCHGVLPQRLMFAEVDGAGESYY